MKTLRSPSCFTILSYWEVTPLGKIPLKSCRFNRFLIKNWPILIWFVAKYLYMGCDRIPTGRSDRNPKNQRPNSIRFHRILWDSDYRIDWPGWDLVLSQRTNSDRFLVPDGPGSCRIWAYSKTGYNRFRLYGSDWNALNPVSSYF